MARSDEAEWWFNAVYSAVQEVRRTGDENSG